MTYPEMFVTTSGKRDCINASTRLFDVLGASAGLGEGGVVAKQRPTQPRYVVTSPPYSGLTYGASLGVSPEWRALVAQHQESLVQLMMEQSDDPPR